MNPIYVVNRNVRFQLCFTLIMVILILAACSQDTNIKQQQSSPKKLISNTKIENSYYGTQLSFASEAVYFLMTDRFVDGDPSNNQVNQGGKYPTYQQPIISKDGRKAYVGYMGGDFKGILNNASYIHDMGFSAIWLTPIVDQPDQSFAGGEPIEFGGAFKDGGKTGYHGYWGDNFYQLDEHLASTNLSFKILTDTLRQKFQIKTILDIVLNHGSPAFSMPEPQEKFGQIFDQNWNIIADHQNLPPEKLNPNNPLHQFYNNKTEIVQLSDVNENNPAVMKYFVNAYLYWINQGANAFRIDTIKHMPHSFWKEFTDKIRAKHPNFFMFAESYSFDANFIAQHTFKENGGVSVLDFPGREAILKTFENNDSNYKDLLSYLHLTDGVYQNPYELMTFYDNHDMARMNADDNGFVDAHNWLFTSRGIPVIYYGSEIGFMAGTKEHEGNRNYFGQSNIALAKNNRIHQQLTQIANIRKNTIALQKGVQINLEFDGNKASFYRIFQHQGINQTALVLLNKGDNKTVFTNIKYISSGHWIEAATESSLDVGGEQIVNIEVSPHSVKILLFNKANTNKELLTILENLM